MSATDPVPSEVLATLSEESLPPLSVAADLTVATGGATATVRSTGPRLFVEIGSLIDAARFAASAPEGGRDRVAAALTATDLTAEVRVRERTVATVGAAARPGVLSRTLGVAPVELRIGGLLAAVGQELSAGVRTVARLLR